MRTPIELNMVKQMVHMGDPIAGAYPTIQRLQFLDELDKSKLQINIDNIHAIELVIHAIVQLAVMQRVYK